MGWLGAECAGADMESQSSKVRESWSGGQVGAPMFELADTQKQKPVHELAWGEEK